MKMEKSAPLSKWSLNIWSVKNEERRRLLKYRHESAIQELSFELRNLICGKTINCGHQCPSTCGEKCPDRRLCQKCGNEAVLERSVDLITFAKYKEINVDEDALVYLSCRHFYTTSSLDGIMKIKEHYNVDL